MKFTVILRCPRVARASKGGGRKASANSSFEARYRSHLRMTEKDGNDGGQDSPDADESLADGRRVATSSARRT